MEEKYNRKDEIIRCFYRAIENTEKLIQLLKTKELEEALNKLKSELKKFRGY